MENKTYYLQRLTRWFRFAFLRLLAIPKSPHDIAKAFAVGVFIGVIPGMGPVVAIVAAFFFRLSKAAAVLGSLTTNPVTATFLYAASYQVGLAFTRPDAPIEWRRLFTFQVGWHTELARLAPTIVIGAVVVGIAAAGLSYFAVRLLLIRYKKIRIHRKTRNRPPPDMI